MKPSVRAGFTIIESMLFLSISALVFVVGFAGIGSRLEAVRYNDSVRNLESDVETVFRNTDDGLNFRSAEADCDTSVDTPSISATGGTPLGQNEQCAVAGVDVAFSVATPGSFTTDSMAVVTGQSSGGSFNFFTPEQINDDSFDISDYLEKAAPIPGTESTYNLEWGLEYTGYVSGGGSIDEDITIRYIRSPVSPQTFIYSYTDSSSKTQLASSLELCFVGESDRRAKLIFEPNATVSVTYQGDECSSP